MLNVNIFGWKTQSPFPECYAGQARGVQSGCESYPQHCAVDTGNPNPRLKVAPSGLFRSDLLCLTPCRLIHLFCIALCRHATFLFQYDYKGFEFRREMRRRPESSPIPCRSTCLDDANPRHTVCRPRVPLACNRGELLGSCIHRVPVRRHVTVL